MVGKGMQHQRKFTLCGCGALVFAGLLVLWGGDLFARDSVFESKKVCEATGTLPDLPKIDVSHPDRFFNDLMLSPLWKVEKARDGSFVAYARSVSRPWPSDGKGAFLFELMARPNRERPEGGQIHNAYLEGNETFSTFQITVVNRKPDLARIALGASGKRVTLPVYESYERKIGPNSTSELAVRLSREHEIYVVLLEQGADPARKTTFAKILPTLRELAGLAETKGTYRVAKRYEAFFRSFFTFPLKDKEIRRFPGIQERDTFYGYFRARPKTRYAGINIKISHPVYCTDECTREHSRLQKAEYLGKPYEEGDLLFFLIEDNAVYLSEKYDQRFGIFTGRESFKGIVEVLNDGGEVLLKSTGLFRGWQR
jgi:hypothetical protein